MVAQLKDAKTIQKMIGAVVKASDKLYPAIHETAVQCILHAQEHGDVTLLDTLISSLDKGTYRGGMKFWAEKFTPIRWNGDGKVGLIGPKKSPTMYEKHLVANKGVAWNVDAAEANPFWTLDEVKADQEKQPVKDERFLGAVAALIKSFEKARDEGNFQGDAQRVARYLEALKAVKVPEAANDPQDRNNVPPTTEETQRLLIGTEAA